MTFRVVELLREAGPGQPPLKRIVRREGLGTRADGLEQARALAERFAVRGFADEPQHWWGRDEEHGGITHSFRVENEDEHSEAIVATTEDAEIANDTELVCLSGIPDEWGTREGDAVQVTVADGRTATFMAFGPDYPEIFHWGYDTNVSRIAHLARVSRTVLRILSLPHLPPR